MSRDFSPLPSRISLLVLGEIMSDWPIWDLDAADALVPQLMALTQDALDQLQHSERAWQDLPFQRYDAVRGATYADLIRADWARAVSDLGAQPQAYFVVALQSIEPETMLCWCYDDTHFAHEFSSWETFEASRRIVNFNRFRAPHIPDNPHSEDDPLRDDWLRDEM